MSKSVNKSMFQIHLKITGHFGRMEEWKNGRNQARTSNPWVEPVETFHPSIQAGIGRGA
jgi:hypothetical protein